MIHPSTTQILVLPARSVQYGLFLTPICKTNSKEMTKNTDRNQFCLWYNKLISQNEEISPQVG